MMTTTTSDTGDDRRPRMFAGTTQLPQQSQATMHQPAMAVWGPASAGVAAAMASLAAAAAADNQSRAEPGQQQFVNAANSAEVHAAAVAAATAAATAAAIDQQQRATNFERFHQQAAAAAAFPLMFSHPTAGGLNFEQLYQQQLMASYIPTAGATCFCPCMYPGTYPPCTIHRTIALPHQSYMPAPPNSTTNASTIYSDHHLLSDPYRPMVVSGSPSSSSSRIPQHMRLPTRSSTTTTNTSSSRSQQKRTRIAPPSPTCSDDEINVSAGSPTIAGGRKCQRIHSPPKTNAPPPPRIDLIDAISDDDDESIAQQQQPPSAPSTIDHHRIGASTAVPSTTLQQQQAPAPPPPSCRHGHCNCHQHACPCVQCTLIASSHCHHYHHHHHLPSCQQLHSPCGCVGAPAPSAPTQIDRQPRNRAFMDGAGLRNQVRQQIHPSHQRLLDQRSAQMEHRRQMSASFYQNRQTSFVQPTGVAYLPPTAAAAASYANDPWSSALAAVPRLTTLRLPHTTGSPPYMMVPNVTGSPSSRLMAGGAQNIIELGMFAIQHGTSVPILVQSTDTLVFNAPANAEPQPVGASVDQIERNTLTQQYKKEDDVPEGEQERCTVCLADFETGELVRFLRCAHLFHVACIDRWLVYNKKCPVCRVDMDKQCGGGRRMPPFPTTAAAARNTSSLAST